MYIDKIVVSELRNLYGGVSGIDCKYLVFMTHANKDKRSEKKPARVGGNKKKLLNLPHQNSR